MVLEQVQLNFEIGNGVGVKVMSGHSESSQCSRILKLLRKKGTVTNRQLNDICFRYSARIRDLRQDGHIIVSNRVKQGLWEFTLKDD